jgi:hypothetical protein
MPSSGSNVRTTAKAPPKARAKPGAKPGVPRRGGNRGSTFVTVSVILVTALAMTALPLCILVLAGCLPTIVAVLVDRHRGRYLARTVGAMNLAGVMPGALKMWMVGISFHSLLQVINSPFTWLVMYGGAAAGWVLYFTVPPIVVMVFQVNSDETRRRLEARAKALVEEWGEEVSGRKREG